MLSISKTAGKKYTPVIFTVYPLSLFTLGLLLCMKAPEGKQGELHSFNGHAFTEMSD